MEHGILQLPASQVLVGAPGRLLAANGFNVQVLRTLDLLRKDEWKALDTVVVQTAVRQLGAIDDLRAAGLTRTLGSLGVLLDEYERASNVDAAEQSMAGVTEGQQDQAAFSLATVPVPITFRDFSLNLRQLEASRRGGSQIDTTNAQLCARRVAEKLEDTLFNGSTVAIGGNSIPGYTTVSSRITGSLTENWASGTNTNILVDVIAIIAALEAQYYFGPFNLYVPVDYNAKLRDDLKANSDRTVRDRLMDIDAIKDIRGTASLTGGASGEVVAAQLASDVVDLSVAQDITTLEWGSMGGLVENFKVMAAMVPRVKTPYGTSVKTGVAHYSV